MATASAAEPAPLSARILAGAVGLALGFAGTDRLADRLLPPAPAPQPAVRLPATAPPALAVPPPGPAVVARPAQLPAAAPAAAPDGRAAAAPPRRLAAPSARRPAAAAPADGPYYRNCAAVREAGAAPIKRGDPGYGPHLDRDGDGVGCKG